MESSVDHRLQFHIDWAVNYISEIPGLDEPQRFLAICVVMLCVATVGEIVKLFSGAESWREFWRLILRGAPAFSLAVFGVLYLIRGEAFTSISVLLAANAIALIAGVVCAALVGRIVDLL